MTKIVVPSIIEQFQRIERELAKLELLQERALKALEEARNVH